MRRCTLNSLTILSPGYTRTLRTSRGQGNSRRAGTTLQQSPHPFIYFSLVPLIFSASLHFSWCITLSPCIENLFAVVLILAHQTFPLHFLTPYLLVLLDSLWQQTPYPWFSPQSPTSSKISQPGGLFMRHILVLIKNIFACIKCFLQSSQIIASSFIHLLCSGRRVNSRACLGDWLNRFFLEKDTDTCWTYWGKYMSSLTWWTKSFL